MRRAATPRRTSRRRWRPARRQRRRRALAQLAIHRPARLHRVVLVRRARRQLDPTTGLAHRVGGEHRPAGAAPERGGERRLAARRRTADGEHERAAGAPGGALGEPELFARVRVPRPRGAVECAARRRSTLARTSARRRRRRRRAAALFASGVAVGRQELRRPRAPAPRSMARNRVVGDTIARSWRRTRAGRRSPAARRGRRAPRAGRRAPSRTRPAAARRTSSARWRARKAPVKRSAARIVRAVAPWEREQLTRVVVARALDVADGIRRVSTHGSGVELRQPAGHRAHVAAGERPAAHERRHRPLLVEAPHLDRVLDGVVGLRSSGQHVRAPHDDRPHAHFSADARARLTRTSRGSSARRSTC